MRYVFIVVINDMILGVFREEGWALARATQYRNEVGGNWQQSQSDPLRWWQSDGPIKRLEVQRWLVE